jgi:NAD(P)-dependent dehydrogenase (short-subunit alcohol dehydrogenase family)
MSGKHALITGSSRGIGRGIALKLADHGVNVAIHYYQNEAAALDTLTQVRERGVAALLCSEQADWITGQVIYADGGASLMNPEVPPEIQLG